MITKVYIQNYRAFGKFDLPLNENVSIIVGDNEEGKSTILEAINLALTKRLNGRLVDYEMTPHLFNSECAKAYLESLKTKTPLPPPSILIEVYLDERIGHESLKGSMNSKKEDCHGIKIEISFDEEYKDEYENLIKEPDKIKMIPIEYYKVQWHSFANHAITSRGIPIRASYIDATTIRLQSGTDYYLQDIIRNDLTPKERVALALEYRNLKETFSDQPAIKGINSSLTSKKGAITEKDLSIAIDISQKSNWESHLVPHLDSLPFQMAGKGEQNALKIMLALERRADESNAILIEEPENHLSYSSMNKLLRKISDKCAEKQIIIATHSTYVLNKLGLDHLILIKNGVIATLKNLSVGTKKYFMKLPGYDTLRLVLAKKAILVEGPSDELIVQAAYLKKHGNLPIDDGVDVISVRGLSFLRFLEIASELKLTVAVVTDNDGDHSKVDVKYASYSGNSNISICRSDNDGLPTLEPQIVDCNQLDVLNGVLGKSFATKDELIEYMQDSNNKTECALKIFETEADIVFPDYVQSAIN